MTAALILTRIDGDTVVAAPAGIIRPALDGAQPLTVNRANVAGDVIYLAPRVDTTWNDGIATRRTHVARTVDHPEHGEILYAYVDMNRLDAAPQLAVIDHARRVKLAAAETAQNARITASVPACHHCRDCAACL